MNFKIYLDLLKTNEYYNFLSLGKFINKDYSDMDVVLPYIEYI